MSDEARRERPDADNRHLLPYGVGGDYVGARRTRRAFRLLVFACIGFTFSLYFVERYMRYELNETQYRMALTLEDDSQRAILRQVVQRDRAQREVPTAKYVEALAGIEEADLVLERYAEAVKLAPDRGALLISYGCRLFQHRNFAEAQKVFREATLKTTRNALPKYLQAAAQAASSETEEDFRTAMALVGRTNDSGEQAVFPLPLWHESLPKSGSYYESLKRRLADEVCTPPLYALRNVVLKRANAALASGEGDFQAWDGWLAQLQFMGERLLGEPLSRAEGGGASAALCGLVIQKDALALRLAFREQRGESHDVEMLSERAARVHEAIALLQEFESGRETAIAEAEAHVTRPLSLAGNGLVFLGAMVGLSWILSRLFQTDKCARTLRQRTAGIRLVIAWAVVLGVVLILSGVAALAPLHGALLVAWYGLLAGIVLYATVAPATFLPTPEAVCHDLLDEPDYGERLKEARQRRLKAYLSLNGRYLNILLGVYVIVLSSLFLGYRVGTGLYPTDVALLIPGMESREIVLFNALYKMLSL